MLNVVMLVKDRPRLTKQAIDSLIENTEGDYRLTVFDDGSGEETQEMLASYTNLQLLRVEESLGPGIARNCAIASTSHKGRGELLYLCDNDGFFLPGWLTTLLAIWPLAASAGFRALGGCVHPYQQPLGQIQATARHSVKELAALGLLSWLMEWKTWDEHGPLAPAPAINGSEDWLLSQKIRKAGGRVGVVSPALVVNCGVTSSNGRACPGAELLYEQEIPAGVLML